jgi:hypothetical protein
VPVKKKRVRVRVRVRVRGARVRVKGARVAPSSSVRSSASTAETYGASRSHRAHP